MPDDAPQPDKSTPARPGPVTAADLEAVRFEDAISDLEVVECHELADRFRRKLKDATDAANEVERRVYFALANVCDFHFKPEERGEPFGAMATFSDGSRTAIPDDFRGDQVDAFEGLLGRLENVPLRTRLADVVWLVTRKPVAAEIAVRGYIEVMDKLLKDEAKPRFDLPHSKLFEATQQLTRALQIGGATKKRREDFPSSVIEAARRLVDTAESQVPVDQRSTAFLRALKLVFVYGIVEPDEAIARTSAIKEIRGLEADSDELRSLYFFVADAHDEADRRPEAMEFRRLAAEELVREYDSISGSGMLASHVLMNAIAEFRRIPGSRDRLKQLEKLLREVQPKVLEEMSPISHKTDISDLVEYTLQQVGDLSLSQALGLFGDLSRSRSQQELRDEALQNLKDFPLSAIFGGARLDDEGKVIANTPAANLTGDPGEPWIKSRISQNESIYRSIVVQGKIEPARRYIVSHHPLATRHFHAIVGRSWLVPPAHRALITLGFARFMQGDFAGATYLLIPQLEHCVRHALKVTGTDPSKIESDLVQKDPSLSVIVEKYKDQVVHLFGSDVVEEIDRLFLYEGGPALRHEAAHGKISGAAAHSADAIYACWFIYRLVCMTVYGLWDEVAAAVEETVG